MKTIVFLVSGNGGTLKFIYLTIQMLKLRLKIVGLVADRDCGAYSFGSSNKIESNIFVINKTNQTDLYQYLKKKKPDIVITNIHKILNKKVLSIESIQFLNLHYSLLPAYAGLIGMKTIDKAAIDNVKFIGATCHEVIEKVDAGLVLGQCMLKSNWKIKNPVDYYDLIFRGANLILLNQLIEKDENTSLKESYKNITFNPGLTFDTHLFTEEFWRKIN